MLKRILPAISYATVIAGASLVAACGQTSYGDAIRAVINERGSKAADTTLDNLEWGLCNAITIGAIRRKYMGTAKWPAYVTICEISRESIEIPK